MKNIFITGANGLLGNFLVRYLTPPNYKVFALALDHNDVDKIQNIKNIYIVLGDVCDKKRIEEIFSKYKFDVVIHLAAIVHRPDAKPAEYMKVNYEGTINLFEQSKKHRIKQFIFLSTVSVYGEETDKLVDEYSKINPSGYYAISKAFAENYIVQRTEKGIYYTIIRATTVYGKYDRGNIHKLFEIAKRRIVPVLGNGLNLKNFIYVEDLVTWIAKTILNSKAYNQIFILGDNVSYSINKILEEIENIIERKIFIIHFPAKITFFFLNILNIIFKPIFAREFFPIASIKKLTTNNTYNISKAKNILNYEPMYTLREGLKKTYISNN